VQVIAVREHLPSLCFTACNIYLPPAVPVSLARLTNLYHNYFHHRRCVLPGMLKRVLSLLTKRDNSFRYRCCDWFSSIKHRCTYTPLPREGTLSALDLTFCSLGPAVQLEWSVIPNLHGSDHYAVNLHISTPPPVVPRRPNWINRRLTVLFLPVGDICGPWIFFCE
jgi:hypothetical protein